METWRPETADEALTAVRDALAVGRAMEIVGTGTRRDLGRPVETDLVLDLSALSGIVDYQPEELVVTVRPGTPLSELAALLASEGQHLAFEPPDFGPLWGLPAGQGTVGGAILTGRGGPRRLTAGAPRDHVLGVKGGNGFGEAFAAGGRVVKNVTGFDLPKLIAGSFGTLAVVTEVTLKVLPAPADTLTLALDGLDDAPAVAAMSRALGGPAAVSAAAHLPADVAPEGIALTLLRLEGVAPSLAARAEQLANLFVGATPLRRLDREAAADLWRAIAAARPFAGSDSLVWRLSLPPSAAPTVAQALGGRRFYDWGGGGLWLETPADDTARVRAALDAAGGDGHATLIRAPASVRSAVAPFQPLAPALAALQGRVKQQFDPTGLFNPGRMYAGQ